MDESLIFFFMPEIIELIKNNKNSLINGEVEVTSKLYI